MLSTLATLAGLTLAQNTDTTFAVRPGTRLDVDNFGGEIAVAAWAENRVRIRAAHSSRDRVDISVSGSTVRVTSASRHGPSQMVDYDIMVPQWMALSLKGVYTDIRIEGTQAAVTAETIEGDVALRGGGGTVTLSSVEGAVTVTGSRGRVAATSLEGEIRITDCSGDIVAETVDGDILLERIQSASVRTNTVDGDIMYDGAIQDNGRYAFITHDGDITVAIPEGANVTVSVALFDGEFDASFPIRLTGQAKRRFSFTIGSGSARLELESFDGDIRLRRPGDVRAGGSSHRNKDKNHDNDL